MYIGAREYGIAKNLRSEQIWLDDINCRGNEARLIDCPANPLGTHNCNHSMNVRLKCAIHTTCNNGQIRLQGGLPNNYNYLGRVEICRNNIWGTICNNGWGVAEAQVVCSELGFSISAGKMHGWLQL